MRSSVPPTSGCSVLAFVRYAEFIVTIECFAPELSPSSS